MSFVRQPAGDFLRSSVSVEEIRGSFSVRDSSSLNKVIVIVGSCRSGTTALLQSFASSGFVCFFQPLKRALRNILSGNSCIEVVYGVDGACIIKETLGPFLPIEVLIDPLFLLQAFGIRKSALKLVIVARRPDKTLASWRRSFFPDQDMSLEQLDTFRLAYIRVAALERIARLSGIETTVYVSDRSSLDQYKALEALYNKLHFPFALSAIDWSSAAPFGSSSSNIKRSVEPNSFRSAGTLDGLKKSIRYDPSVGDDTSPPLPSRICELHTVYSDLLSRSKSDLGI